jgi:hypothetical protein
MSHRLHNYGAPSTDSESAFEEAWFPWIESKEKERYRPSMRDAGRAMWDAAIAHAAEWVQTAAKLANEVAVTLDAWDAEPGGDELREIFEAKMGDLGRAFDAYMAGAGDMGRSALKGAPR